MSKRNEKITWPPLQTCPQCGEAAGVPIVRGYPTVEAAEAASTGRIELGGCLISEDDPDWSCRSCGHTWRDAGPNQAEG